MYIFPKSIDRIDGKQVNFAVYFIDKIEFILFYIQQYYYTIIEIANLRNNFVKIF